MHGKEKSNLWCLWSLLVKTIQLPGEYFCISRGLFTCNVFSPCPLLPVLLNVFFLLSSE